MGANLNLTASTITGASYSWSGPNSFTSSIQNPSVSGITLAGGGTYSVTATVAGCTGLAGTTTLTVNPIPTAPTLGSNTPVCQTFSLNLTAANVAGGTFSWIGPNGFSSSFQNPIIPNVSLAADGSYSATVTVLGCTSPAATTFVTVKKTPLAPVAGNNGPLCVGSNLNLTAGAIGGASYSWTGPAGFTSAGQNPSLANVALTNAGTYSVTASLAGCTGPAGSTTLTVNPIPVAPSAGNNGPLCEGNTLNLTSTTITGATYNWSGPNSFNSTSQNSTLAGITMAGAGSYSVTATVAGCTGPAGTTSVTVNPIPAAPTAGSDSPVCQNYALSLTANTVAGATYAWTGPNGFTSALQNPTIANVSPAAAGSYSVSVTVAGCLSASSSTSVVVKLTPAAPTATNNGPLCVGNNLNLSASNIAGVSYDWTGPNGFTSSLQNPIYNNVALTDAGIYSVKATLAGCQGLAGTTNVAVNPIPATPTPANNGPICVGQTLNLSVAAITGATYSWSGPGGFTSSLQNPSLGTITLAKAGTYSVNVTVAGCGGAAGTTAVVVNPIPASPTASNDGPHCEGFDLNLTAGNVAGATYNWSGPNGFNSNLQNPVINAIPFSGNGNYNVTATVNGCTSPATITNAVIKAVPAALTLGSNSAICATYSLNLTANTVAGGTYSWTGPNGFVSSVEDPSIPNVALADAGTYEATTTVNGCTSPISTTDVVVLSVGVAPPVSNNGPLCVGDTLNLTTAASAGASYSWTGPNGFTSASQTPSLTNITLARAGNYSVTITANGCTTPPGTTNVAINSIPTSPVASNNGPLCEGATLNLAASTIAGATYSWTGPNGFTSTDQNPIIANTTTGESGVYTVSSLLNGCSSPGVSTNAVVNTIPNAPSIASNSPVCQTFTLNLTANTVAGATYIWTGPNGFSSTLQNPSLSSVGLSAAGKYIATVTVAGCLSPADTLDVVIYPIGVPPTVSNNGPVCAGQSLTLDAQTVTGATYNWTGPNGFTSNLEDPIITNPTTTASGNYAITVTVNGCTSPAATTPAVIKAIPAAPSPTTNGPLCVGNTLNLNANAITGATYSWTGANGFSSVVQNPSRSNIALADAGVYSVMATVNGCTGPAGSTTLIVNPIPAAPVPSSNTPVCETSTLSLTANTVSGATYNWNGPAGYNSNLQNPSRSNVPLTAAGNYSLTVTVSGCTSPAATTNVVVKPTPVLTLANSGPLCVGQALNLTANAVSGATYSWSGPNGFTSILEDPSIASVTLVQAGAYTAAATLNGCVGPNAVTTVTINAIPASTALNNNGPLCVGNTLNLTSNAVTGATYSWSGPAGFISALQNPSIANVSLVNAGAYTATITVNGCTSSASASDVEINPIPATPAATNNGPVCAAQTLNLNAGTIAGATYSWTGLVGFSSGVEDPTIPNVQVANSGTYSVRITVMGCSSALGSTSVIVNPIPAAPVVTNNGPLCVGNNLSLTASTITGATYAWTGPNGFTSAVQNPSLSSVTLSNAGSYSVSATVNSCQGPSSTSTVIINSIPAAPTASSNEPICAGQNLNLTAANITGATFSWTGPNGFASALQNPSITAATVLASGNYIVNTTVSGCSSPNSTVPVVVKPTPMVTASNNGPLCEGSTLILTANNISGASYSWSGPSGFTSTLENPSISNALVAQSGNYAVTATLNGCPSTASITSAVINLIPAAPIVANNTPLCVGQTLNLTANTVANATYSWTGPNGFNSTLEDPIKNNITMADSGNYTATVRVNGCTSPAGTTNAVINPIPAALVISSNSPVCETFDINLSSNTVSSGTYAWTGPNGFNSALEDPIIKNATLNAAGTYSATVTVNGCESAAATTSVIVNAIPTVIATGNGPLCAGQTLNLTASNVAGGAYSWTGPNGFASSSQNPVVNNTTVADSGLYAVNVTVNGCQSASASTIRVSINSIPDSPTASNNGPICGGVTLNLSASTIVGASYNWTGPNGFTSTLQNPSISNATPTVSGTYAVTATVAGCNNIAGTTNAIINSIPMVTASSNAPLCFGNSLNLSATNLAGATYTWSGPDGFTSSLQNPVINNVDASNSGDYAVTATLNGCSSNLSTLSAIMNPIPEAPTLSSNGPVCEGSTLTLQASNIIGGAFVWTGPNGFASTLQNNSITNVPASAGGEYSTTVTVNGCTSSAAVIIAVVNPIATAPVPSNNGPVCPSQTLNLTVPSVIGALYNWTGPDGFTSTTQNPTIPNVSNVNAGAYSVTITVNGCTSTPGSTNVLVNGIPSVTASSNMPVCDGQALNLAANDVSGATYSWTGPNGFTSNVQNPSIPNASNILDGDYSVTVTVNGCTSNATASTTVAVNPVPSAPNISNNGPVCELSSLNLTSNTVAGATYIWSGPNGFSSTIENPSVASASISASGTYSATITLNGCTSAPATTDAIIRPTPVITVSANSPVCEGIDLNLTASNISGATYTWTGPNVFTSSLFNPTINNATAQNSGTYAVTATLNGCTSPAASVIITVNPIPSTPVASNDAPVCAGKNINLTASSISGATYSWTGPNGFISAAKDTSRMGVTLADSGTYAVIATVNGCASLAGTTDVVINPSPTIVASNNGPLCPNATLNLSVTPVAGATYSWAGPNGFNATIQNPSINNVILADSGLYAVTATLNGCISNASTFAIIRNAPPAVIRSNSPICLGSNLSITADTIPGAIYSWTGPNNFASSNQNIFINPVALKDSGTYQVSVAVAGCSGSSLANTKIVVNTIPSVPVPTNSGPACEGSTLSLSATNVPGGSFRWTHTNGFMATQKDTLVSNITLADSGDYSLTVTVGGCTSPAAKTYVSVKPAPQLNASSNSPVCVNSNLNLMANAIAGINYSWTGPNGFTSALQNPSIANATLSQAGTYTVTATLNGCTSPASSVAVAVNTIPAKPEVSNNGPACEGSTLALISNGISGIFKWTGPNGFVSSAKDTSITAVALSSSGTYSFTVSVNGCKSDEATTEVLIKSRPQITSVSNTGPSCENGKIDLASVTSSGVTYAWTGPNGFNSALQNPSLNKAAVSDTGAYTLVITDILTGCKSASSATRILVTPVPVLSMLSRISPCSGTNVTLNANTIPSASYSWAGPNGYSSLKEDALIGNISLNDQGSYRVIVVLNGCSDTNNIVVNVNQSPVAGYTSSFDMDKDSAYFTDASSIASGKIVSRTWNFGDSTTSILLNPNHYYDSIGWYQVSLKVTSDSGCVAVKADSIFSNRKTVHAFFSVLGNCQGQLVSFKDSSRTLKTKAVQWSWNFGDGKLSANQNPSHSYTSAGTYPVTLIATGANGVKDTIVKDIVVSPSPLAKFGYFIDCFNAAQFKDSSTMENGMIASWKWQFGDTATSTLQNPVHAYVKDTIYNATLIVTSINGCIDTTTKVIATLPKPKADFILPELVKPGVSVGFKDTSVFAVSWKWDFGDKLGNAISKNPIYTYKDLGLYQVKLIVQNAIGCSDSITKPLNISNGPIAVPNAFTPNGDGHNDVLMVNGDLLEGFNFTIYNVWGNVIFSSKDQTVGWDGTFKGQNQPAGVYIYTLQGKSKDNQDLKISGEVTLLRY